MLGVYGRNTQIYEILYFNCFIKYLIECPIEFKQAKIATKIISF